MVYNAQLTKAKRTNTPPNRGLEPTPTIPLFPEMTATPIKETTQPNQMTRKGTSLIINEERKRWKVQIHFPKLKCKSEFYAASCDLAIVNVDDETFEDSLSIL